MKTSAISVAPKAEFLRALAADRSALTFRATYSEAFHAPTLSDLFRGVQVIADFIFDPRSPVTGSESSPRTLAVIRICSQKPPMNGLMALSLRPEMVEPASGSDAAGRFLPIDLRAVTAVLDPQFLVDHEDQFPGQVIAGPQPARVIRSARSSFSYFRNKIWVG